MAFRTRKQQQQENLIRLTPEQQKRLSEEEIAKCKYKESADGGMVVVEYDRCPIIEVPMSLIKADQGYRDFRDIPIIVERILQHGIIKLKPRNG
jgi:hypothetical protein